MKSFSPLFAVRCAIRSETGTVTVNPLKDGGKPFWRAVKDAQDKGWLVKTSHDGASELRFAATEAGREALRETVNG